MPRSFGRCAAALASCAILAALFAGGAAVAQTPRPSPSPVPTPVAFSAHAHANVTVVTQSATFTGSVQLAVAQRTNLMRFDVLSVKSDAFPLPPFAVTAVLDRGANTVTIWNDTTKQYHVQSFLPGAAGSAPPRPSMSPRPSTSPRAAGPLMRGRSPFADLEMLSMTLKMTGHTTTSGLPTTGMSFDFQVQRKGDKTPSHVIATTQLADEFSAFPMTVDVSIEPGMAPVTAKLSYAVDDLSRDTPPLVSFKVPAGYTETSSVLAVIFPGRFPVIRSPSPVPSPR